jgi:hypothetical protein
VLLQIFNEGSTMDLAADTLLHYISPVELEARVCGVHASRCQLRGCDATNEKGMREHAEGN